MNAIEIENLTKKFKDKVAVNNINLEVKEGELFALLGTNGAGKTTTIKMMSTLIMPTDGEIKVLGYDTKKDYMKIRESIKAKSKNIVRRLAKKSFNSNSFNKQSTNIIFR